MFRRWKHFAAMSVRGCGIPSRKGASISCVRSARWRANSRPARASSRRRVFKRWERFECCLSEGPRSADSAFTHRSSLVAQKRRVAATTVETTEKGQNRISINAWPAEPTNGRSREIESTPNGAPTAKYMTKALSRFTLRTMNGWYAYVPIWNILVRYFVQNNYIVGYQHYRSKGKPGLIKTGVEGPKFANLFLWHVLC
jgi:hypothetical protein